MKFIEVNGLFSKYVEKDEKDTLKSMFGEEREDWPEEYQELVKNPLSVNVDLITSFNPSNNPKQTTLRMINDPEGYLLDMTYEDFKKLIHAIQK